MNSPFQFPIRFTGSDRTAMSDEYFVRSQGKISGPFTFAELKTKAGKGHLKKTHQISTDQKQWQSARRFEELFPPPRPPQTRPVETAKRQQPADLVEVTILEDEPLEIDDETQWHYCLQGDEQTQGPVSEEKLKRLFQSGRLPIDTLVWNETLTDWVEARRIPAFQAGTARAASVPHVEIPLIDPAPSAGEHPGGELPAPPLASASLILSILGIAIPVIVPSLLAIVFGHLSLGQIKANRQRYGGENMAKTGIIIGYVTLVVLILIGAGWLIYQLADK